MTAQASALTRLHRALANPSTSALQIRAIAGEPPRVGLEDALAIVIALYDREAASFAKAAARWAARLVLEHRLTLPDAQLTFAALAALEGPTAPAGAEALAELAERVGLRDVDQLLARWLAPARWPCG